METSPILFTRKETSDAQSSLLILKQEKKKNNWNIIYIFFGVCDAQGEWIYETNEEQAFVKEKLKPNSTMAQGIRQISPWDVSRYFHNKVVKIFAYSKPSLLRYSGKSSIEERIDYSLFEPLISRDVCFQAKKENEKS